ncbi:disease resistance protein Pik-2-like [Lolium perenne]|uniref:disease resistance protein Pik-2-like n=1 Tax=Lolium perenne TaxID=4522 RepID=UPI003A9A37FA
MVGATASALIGAMNLLLSKLSTLLEREFGKLAGVKRDIAFLRDELSSMNTALEAVSSAEEVSPKTKNWMGQLRELSYDAEDCIEIFMQNLDNQDSYGTMWKAFHGLITLWKRHSIADEIAVLKQRAEEIHSRSKRFEFNMTSPSTSTSTTNAMSIDPRLPALFEEADRLVGVEASKDEIVKWLTQDIKKWKVISVAGSGGLGKTTLANLVYKEIKSLFDCTAFVSVSQNPDTNKILKDILLQVLETSSHASADQRKLKQTIKSKLGLGPIQDLTLICMIREFLKNCRYLILIDDIWSKDAWEAMKYAFPENDYTSGIMITTRINDVAKHCCFPQEKYAYFMKPLTSVDSKRLFFKKLFLSEEECSQDLKEVAGEILKKCDGLPLAIINIASLLATKAASRQEWKRVLESFSSPLNQDYEVDVVKRAISVSYYDLPHHLKICLLYLSVYPEDHIIDIEQLIWRWIAEGFIIGQHGQNLDEVGERYFNELVNRNMIQLVEADITGRGISCRVHDIMLEILISLSSEENFVTIVNSKKLTSSTSKTRCLSLQGNCEENQAWLGIGNFSHARSLNVFGDCMQLPPLKGLQTLRVLDLLDHSYSREDNGHIENIVSLLQLRYLYVCRQITKVPREIQKLQLLQTLDLSRTYVTELPATIVQLKQLVRLFVPGEVKFPSGIGTMRALQELWALNCRSNSVNIVVELGNLVKLKKLAIVWDFNEESLENYKKSFVSSLSKLVGSSLECLSISSSMPCRQTDWLLNSWCPPPRNLNYLNMGDWFSIKIDRLIPSFSSLVFLSIKVVHMVGREYLQPLKELPVLVHLILQVGCPSSEELFYPVKVYTKAFTISNDGFESLKRFDFIMPIIYDPIRTNHMGWHVEIQTRLCGPLMFEEGAVRKLQLLKIECPGGYMLSLEGVGSDLGIHHIKSLQHLEVSLLCSGMWACEVDPVEAAIRNAATLIPNHPKLEIKRIGEEDKKQNVEVGENIFERIARGRTKEHKLIPKQVRRWSFN